MLQYIILQTTPTVLVCLHLFIPRGMDPILFAVLCGMGSGVLGYMVGANLFLKLWALMYRKDHQKLQEVGVVMSSLPLPLILTSSNDMSINRRRTIFYNGCRSTGFQTSTNTMMITMAIRC